MKPVELDSMKAAAEHIGIWLSNHQDHPRPVVAIGGAVGSGKSTLAAMLEGSVLSTDEYLPDYDQVEPELRDKPESADLDRLLSDLGELKRLGQANVPKWSFQEHRRVGQTRMRAAGLIVCEGIFALHPAIGDAVDIRVLIRAESTVRWGRWKAIEEAGKRGWGVKKARKHFEEIAEPTYSRYSHLYETDLDLIVTNDA